jgi:hypothetical protein
LDTTVSVYTADDSEIDQMDVNGMTPTSGRVLQFPNLESATRWLGKDTVLDVREGNAVDLPFSILTLEFEGSVDIGLGWWKGKGS